MPITLLALDTATTFATVAITEDGQLLAEGAREVTTHSEGLLLLLDECLTKAQRNLSQMTAIVAGRGPGSFTGLRIGLATAKGLCLAADKPLLIVSSLLPLAAAAQATLSEPAASSQLIATLLDARRQEVYGALYRAGQPLTDEVLLSPNSLVDFLRREEKEPILLVGDGALLYREKIEAELGESVTFAAADCHQIRARYLALATSTQDRAARADFDNLATSAPHYIRPSDAKIPTSALGISFSEIKRSS